MRRNCKILLSIGLFFIPVQLVSAAKLADAEQLFKQQCSLCHAIDKKKLGPAVNTMSDNQEILRQVISKGRKSMPAYAQKLTSAQIEALVDYLLSKQ